MVRLEKVGKDNGLFLCTFCNKKVIKENSNGKAQKSCGCAFKLLMQVSLKKHDGKGTRLYNIWKGIKVRCYNKRHHSYRSYGMKGIKICNEWINNFVVFKKWAIENGYNDVLVIDRKDNKLDYMPGNCQWILPELNAAKDKIKYTESDIQKIRWLYICCKWTKTKISTSLGINRTRIRMVVTYNNKDYFGSKLFEKDTIHE